MPSPELADPAPRGGALDHVQPRRPVSVCVYRRYRHNQSFVLYNAPCTVAPLYIYTVRYGTVWYCTGKGSVPYLVADYFGRFGPLERKTVKENPAP